MFSKMYQSNSHALNFQCICTVILNISQKKVPLQTTLHPKTDNKVPFKAAANLNLTKYSWPPCKEYHYINSPTKSRNKAKKCVWGYMLIKIGVGRYDFFFFFFFLIITFFCRKSIWYTEVWSSKNWIVVYQCAVGLLFNKDK